MVDNSVNLALDSLVTTTEKINRDREEKDRVKELEERLKHLLENRKDISPAEAMNLRSEAALLDKMANFTLQLADKLERDKESALSKKKLEEVKEALMEQLGIPEEFVNQLSILVKAGPEALREASIVYRAEAQRKRDRAELINLEVERIDNEIAELNAIKEEARKSSTRESQSSSRLILQKLYEEAIRDKADEELKRVLEMMEGSVHGVN